MKGKIWIPLAIVAVAAVAFVIGWQFRGATTPAEEPTVSEPAATTEPAPVVEEPSRAAATPPAARRRPPAPKPAAAPPPETPAPAPMGSYAAPSEAPAPDTGVRRVESVQVRVAEGTKILFTLNDTLSTKTNREGDPFSGVVSRSVRVGKRMAIPQGSVVRGAVARVERAGRVKGRSELGLRFDQLELPDGQVYDLSASLTQLEEREKETVTEEGQVKGAGTKKRDVLTIGGGAGIGAAIGAIAGGGKGAATGGAVGAGAGAAMVLLTRGKDVEVPRGTELAIQLDRPLTVSAK